MAMRAVACERDMLELRGVARDSPRLAQRDAARAWRLAGQTVHAPIEMIGDAAPAPEAGLHLTVTPICTGFWPLYRHAAAIGDTRFSGNPEVAPKAVEDRPMLADLPACGGTFLPVNPLVC